MAISRRWAPTSIIEARNTFLSYKFILPLGTTLEDAMASETWVHVIRQLRVDDIVTVIAADRSFDTDLRVTDVFPDRGEIRFMVIREIPKKQTKVSASGVRFDVKHAGHGKWRIIDTASNEIVSDNLSRDAAEFEAAELNAPAKAA